MQPYFFQGVWYFRGAVLPFKKHMCGITSCMLCSRVRPFTSQTQNSILPHAFCNCIEETCSLKKTQLYFMWYYITDLKCVPYWLEQTPLTCVTFLLKRVEHFVQTWKHHKKHPQDLQYIQDFWWHKENGVKYLQQSIAAHIHQSHTKSCHITCDVCTPCTRSFEKVNLSLCEQRVVCCKNWTHSFGELGHSLTNQY